MSSVPLYNSFEAGPAGATVTGGNSGGASGNPFDAVVIGTGSVIFDQTHARSGLALRVATPTSSSNYVNWTGLGGITVSTYFRAYLYITALPNAHWYFGRNQTAANAKVMAMEIDTAGKFLYENGGGTDVAAATSTSVAPTNQWFRVEWRVLPSATVGEVEYRLYLTDPDAASGDYTETKNNTAQTLAADIGQAQFGIVDTAAPTNYSAGAWLDEIAVSTDGWVGPALPVKPTIPRRMPLGV